MNALVWATIISGVIPTIAVVLGHLGTRKRIDQVHVIVNGRFEQALARIKLLEAEVRRLLEDLERTRSPDSS